MVDDKGKLKVISVSCLTDFVKWSIPGNTNDRIRTTEAATVFLSCILVERLFLSLKIVRNFRMLFRLMFSIGFLLLVGQTFLLMSQRPDQTSQRVQRHNQDPQSPPELQVGDGPLSETEFQSLMDQLQEESAAWKSIPWQTSMVSAQNLAAEQQKPIFIWAMDGHPLGCT